jgi:YVTN family beta-propeller protein
MKFASLLSVVSAQWLETTIYLPDTMYHGYLCYNSQNNKVYCTSCTGSFLGYVVVIDGATNQVVTTIPVGLEPDAHCYNPTNNKVYSAHWSGMPVTVIDGATNGVITTVPTGGSNYALCYNPTNNKVYSSSDDHVVVIDGAADTVIAIVPGSPQTCFLCYNPTSNKVYSANFYGNVTVIDGATNQVVATVRTGDGCCAVIYNPTNNKVYSANSGSDDVTVIDGATNQVIATVPVGHRPGALCYNSTNNKVYCANMDDAWDITVIDGASNQVITTLPVAAVALYYNDINNKVYCGGLNVSILDGASDSVIREIAVGGGPESFCHNVQQNRVYAVSYYSGSISVLRDSMPVGIRGTPNPERRTANAATVARGVLFLPEAAGLDPQASILLDIAGRKVLDLRPGPNDVSRLASGVYFVRAVSRKLSAVSCQKVVLAE